MAIKDNGFTFIKGVGGLINVDAPTSNSIAFHVQRLSDLKEWLESALKEVNDKIKENEK